jgi:hypothetical protein
MLGALSLSRAVTPAVCPQIGALRTKFAVECAMRCEALRDANGKHISLDKILAFGLTRRNASV